MIRYFLFILLFSICSCSSNNIDKFNCIDNDVFNVSISGSGIDNIHKKQILNKIINESSIKFDETSIYLINLNINVKQTTSLVSENNSVKIINVNFTVNYKVINKMNGLLINTGKFIVVDEINVSDNRFANYSRDNYIMDNFTDNLVSKLENRIKILLNNRKCKKV